MKLNFFRKCIGLSFFTTVLFLTGSSFAESIGETNSYWAISLSSNSPAINRYGVPFVEGTLAIQQKGPAHIEVGGRAKRIFLLGMTDTAKAHSWTNLGDKVPYARRYFIGDEMGTIELDYADGSSQVFPLVFGESLWWGSIFTLILNLTFQMQISTNHSKRVFGSIRRHRLKMVTMLRSLFRRIPKLRRSL